jgi:hypothetical protein
MRKLLLVVAASLSLPVLSMSALCLSGSSAMAQLRNCAAAFPDVAHVKGLRARLACMEANEQELAALLTGPVQIRSEVMGDMGYGNPWCLMIRAGVNTTVAKNCIIHPDENGSLVWHIVPAR